MLTQNERKKLIEEIIENKNPVIFKDNAIYIINKENSSLTISNNSKDSVYSVSILICSNQTRFDFDKIKQTEIKDSMFYINDKTPFCIPLGKGILYEGSSYGLEKAFQAKVYKNLGKEKNNLLDKIADFDERINEINDYHKEIFDSFIIGYSILEKMS
jgi:hypothetical protein